MDPRIVLGQTESHLVPWKAPIKIHRDVVEPFKQLKGAALKAGFELEICSGFRGFEAQSKIWNEKMEGKRPILDDNNVSVDISRLSPWEKIQKILRWSALPGTSRHHWGTDFDIFDAKKMSPNYKIQLIPSEYDANGIFGDVSTWLDSHMRDFGFYRPYDLDRGGVSPERWHLSFGPLASQMSVVLSEELIHDAVAASTLNGKDEILTHLSEIFNRYVSGVARFV